MIPFQQVCIEYDFLLDEIQIKVKMASKQLKFAHTPVRGVLNQNMKPDLDFRILENATSSIASLQVHWGITEHRACILGHQWA